MKSIIVIALAIFALAHVEAQTNKIEIPIGTNTFYWTGKSNDCFILSLGTNYFALSQRQAHQIAEVIGNTNAVVLDAPFEQFANQIRIGQKPVEREMFAVGVGLGVKSYINHMDITNAPDLIMPSIIQESWEQFLELDWQNRIEK